MGMNDVQRMLMRLRGMGWTFAAIADEIGVHRETVVSWGVGRHSPSNVKLVLPGLGNLMRKRVPKKRRYTKSPPTP